MDKALKLDLEFKNVNQFCAIKHESKQNKKTTKITRTIPSHLFLLLLVLTTPDAGQAVDIELASLREPSGAVLLVVDGLGASYVYPEHRAYALDGSPLEGAVLFNLTGSGARAIDVRVPFPETTRSHSVLITGQGRR